MDILKLDATIKKKISDETGNIDKYRKELDQYKSPKHKRQREEILEKIQDIESGAMMAEYILYTEKILCEYSEIIKTPVEVSFLDNKKVQKSKINELVQEYLTIASKYIDVYVPQTEDNMGVTCNCGSKSFTTVDNIMYCDKCSIEIKMQSSQTSFKDIDRINTSQKYKYRKQVHFKDTVNQYQGKQNKKNSDEELYAQLEKEFIKMGLVDEKESNWFKRHEKITKDIIYMVLDYTGNNKRYEDINLIHNHFTGIPCPDISHLEHQLYIDFDRIVAVYDKYKSDRKNFLHSRYVLYQLLRIYEYKVDTKDFDILTTPERLVEHDYIWEKICYELEMPFYSCV